MRVADILNLPGWSVLDVEERDDRYIIQAKPSAEGTSCPACGNNAILRHGADLQQIHDLPCHGKQVSIAVEKQRYRCRWCRKTWFAVLPEVDEQHNVTLRLVRYVQRQSLTRTFVQVATETGISERSVRRLFDDYVAILEQKRQAYTPCVLGQGVGPFNGPASRGLH